MAADADHDGAIVPLDPPTRRSCTGALLVFAWLTAPLSAHAGGIITPAAVWSAWTFEPLVLGSLTATSWLYARGVRRLASSQATGARRISRASAWWFAGGQAALIVALVSPLDALSDTLLSAHMVQHAILAGVAPPLLLLGSPGVAFAWGVRGVMTIRRLAPVCRSLGRIEKAVSTPLPAAVIYGLTIWLWHSPVLFDLAVEHDWVHALQHLSFFTAATLFWRPLLRDRSAKDAAGAAGAAFVTFMHTGLLGALITMAPESLYPVYVGRTASWGLTALADQQLAGLLMWVPLGLPYVVGGLVRTSSLVRGHVEDMKAAHLRAGRVDSGPR
jgi:putative membrane protein